VFTPRIRSALLVLSASVGLAGCAGVYGPGYGVNVGYGNGYDPYYGAYGGYGGYGSRYGSYGSPYGYGAGYGYGSPYGYGGYGSPYYGWYDSYYYPGTGYYVYDRSGSRYRWSDAQRRYWESRRPSSGARVLDNWSRYQEGVTVGSTTAPTTSSNGVTTTSTGRQVIMRQPRAERPSAMSRPQRIEERSQRLETRDVRRAERVQARETRRSARDDN
jgi:hypothetical protein